MTIKLSLTALLFCMLTACGFHLKGVGNDRINLHTIQLISTDDNQNAYHILKNTLANNHIIITKEAPWKAVISDFRQTRTITAIGSDDSTREIELVDSYQVTLFYNGEKIDSTTISNRTNISYSSSEYLGGIAEEKSAHHQLAWDNADATLRFIDAISTNQPQSKK